MTTTDIAKFSGEYKGSLEERCDILKSYEQHKGDVCKIIESVMLLEADESLRICEIITEAINAGEIVSYAKFTKYAKQLQSTGCSSSSSSISKKQKVASEHVDIGASSLESLILSKHQNKGKAFDDLINKYSQPSTGKSSKQKKSNAMPEISDEEFNRIRDKITKKK